MTKLFLFLFFGVFLEANAAFYPVPDNSSPLRENANAIVRLDSGYIELRSKDKAFGYYKFAITILNERGKEKGVFRKYYDNLSDIKKLTIRLYDNNGKLSGTVKSSEISDKNTFILEDNITDTRMKYFNPQVLAYPYTIEFEYTVIYSGSFHAHNWSFQYGENTSVEKSVLSLKIPEDYKFHYKQINFNETPDIKTKEGLVFYTWEKKSMKALELEPYGLSSEKLATSVLLSSDQFEFGGIQGDMSSWQSLGKWIYEINEGRDMLSPETISKIKVLVANAKTLKEKVDIIYRYAQQRTRYESIQLGIGGFQTFTAEYVDKYGIGDCKALSNYVHALLKAVDVPSIYAAVRANRGGNDIIPDFVSSQFNHIILCVPDTPDSIWLECTNRNKPAGFLGDFTDNRSALLITSKGGILTKTPNYAKKDNYINRIMEIRMNNENTLATLDVNSNYSGLMAEERIEVHALSAEMQLNWVKENFKADHFSLDKLTMHMTPGPIPVVEEHFLATAKNIMIKTKEGFIVQPILYEGSMEIPENIEERTQPVVIPIDYSVTDTIRFGFSSVLKAENLPSINFSSVFGKYSLEVKMEHEKLVFIRTFSFNKGTYSSEKYPELIKFLKGAAKGDKTKVLVSL